jgi:hypothetical protein
MKELVKKIAQEFNIEFAALMAFIEVESGGRGFDPASGKIMIQFEPAWFKRKVPNAPAGIWSQNRVERQEREWIAFTDAFKINPDAAMESTSIGLGQVMGFHYRRLGYETVGAMWDDAKKGIDRQIWQMAMFIVTDSRLLKALKDKNWHMVATYYNGAGYRALAARIGREPYDVSMAKAYAKYS